jgi:hypothetical protein
MPDTRLVTLDRSGGKKLGVRLGNAASEDFGIPVLSVEASGQANGKLVAGDVVTEINGNSVLGMTMGQAAAFVVSSDSVVLRLACTVLFFRLKFTLEDAIGSHACSLEALACV